MAILPANIKISLSEETHETVNRLIDALESLHERLPIVKKESN